MRKEREIYITKKDCQKIIDGRSLSWIFEDIFVKIKLEEDEVISNRPRKAIDMLVVKTNEQSKLIKNNAENIKYILSKLEE